MDGDLVTLALLQGHEVLNEMSHGVHDSFIQLLLFLNFYFPPMVPPGLMAQSHANSIRLKVKEEERTRLDKVKIGPD